MTQTGGSVPSTARGYPGSSLVRNILRQITGMIIGQILHVDCSFYRGLNLVQLCTRGGFNVFHNFYYAKFSITIIIHKVCQYAFVKNLPAPKFVKLCCLCIVYTVSVSYWT